MYIHISMECTILLHKNILQCQNLATVLWSDATGILSRHRLLYCMNCNKTPKFHCILLWQRCHKSPGVISSCMSKQDAGIIARWLSNLEQNCLIFFLSCKVFCFLFHQFTWSLWRDFSASLSEDNDFTFLLWRNVLHYFIFILHYSSQYVIIFSVTVQPCKEDIVFIFYFYFYCPRLDSKSHFYTFTLFSAMYLFKEQQRTLMSIC